MCYFYLNNNDRIPSSSLLFFAYFFFPFFFFLLHFFHRFLHMLTQNNIPRINSLTLSLTSDKITLHTLLYNPLNYTWTNSSKRALFSFSSYYIFLLLYLVIFLILNNIINSFSVCICVALRLYRLILSPISFCQTLGSSRRFGYSFLCISRRYVVSLIRAMNKQLPFSSPDFVGEIGDRFRNEFIARVRRRRHSARAELDRIFRIACRRGAEYCAARPTLNTLSVNTMR